MYRQVYSQSVHFQRRRFALSYGPDRADIFAARASYVDRILTKMAPNCSRLSGRIALGAVIARILPSATCRGRWLNPQELVIIV